VALAQIEKQEIGTNEQIQSQGEHRGGVTATSTCTGSTARKRRSRHGSPKRGFVDVDRQLGGDVCVHLRAYVHRVSSACFGGGHHHRWIMTQHPCEKARRHAGQRRCRKWWLARALCFLHQPLHRGPGSHHNRVLAHPPTVDPRSWVRP